MHKGEDTHHYLARGLNVVAVEANPALVQAMQQRFRNEIAAGRLTIVGAAVAGTNGTTQLAVSDQISVWSSLDPSFIRRAEDLGTTYKTITVPSVRFEDLIATYGVPHYLKIDIEGADMLCLRGLQSQPERPDYVSIESSVTSPAKGLESAFDELAHLWVLGYRGFKFVDQSKHPDTFPPDSSGPFGEDTPGRWMSIVPAIRRAAAIRLQYDMCGYGGRWQRTLPGRAWTKFRIDVLHRPQGWYDLHARLAAP